MRGLSSTQFLKAGQSVGPQHHRLAVDREARGLDPLRSSRDRGQSRYSQGVARVKPDCGAVPTHDQPVAIMLDFVDPIGTG
jgi:hypothetical protein